MGWEYIPEPWRKKFTKGQKIWYFDHIENKIYSGVFERYNPCEREYSDTVAVNSDKYTFCHMIRVLESWVFTDKDLADKYLKASIRQKVKSKERELLSLKKKLKGLE